ncbi:hypothetical protein BX666DRAFT_2001616 [Dichotomocladium elegans]|nr:hypothetical protein BX666DRAFT_2001616 [Dichotomocladium elegans]
MNQGKTALVLGSTGAVGKALLKNILRNGEYAKVITVGRRPAQLDDTIPQDRLVQKTIDFENLEKFRDDFKGVNDVYCCLGTTRADAGSAEAFRKIDQGYVVQSAKIIVEENKLPSETLSPVHFLYCSSTGANKSSPFLYPQSKGQTEDGISKAGFARVSIFRPGFLMVEEPRPSARFGERFYGKYINPITRYFNLSMSVPVVDVADAMRKVAQEPYEKGTEPIVKIFTNAEIETLAKREP